MFNPGLVSSFHTTLTVSWLPCSDQRVLAISVVHPGEMRIFPLDFHSVSDLFIQMSQSCWCYCRSGTNYSHREKTNYWDFVLPRNLLVDTYATKLPAIPFLG